MFKNHTLPKRVIDSASERKQNALLSRTFRQCSPLNGGRVDDFFYLTKEQLKRLDEYDWELSKFSDDKTILYNFIIFSLNPTRMLMHMTAGTPKGMVKKIKEWLMSL